MLENTEGVVKKDNPEKLATQGTQETGQIHVREYRSGNNEKYNPEKLATQGTQDTGILENTEGVIKKRTIQRQLWVHKTQDK